MSSSGESTPRSQDEIITASKVIKYRDEALTRIEKMLLKNEARREAYHEDEYDPDFEKEKRVALYKKLEMIEEMHISDGNELADVGMWIKATADATDIEERHFEKHLEQMVKDDIDTVSKSLNQAKALKAKMTEISGSLVSSARTEHTTLRKKLKEQYFSFQSQLASLVSHLEEEEEKRRMISLTSIMLKQKVQVLKMKLLLPRPQGGVKLGDAPAQNDDGDDHDKRDLRSVLAQKELDIEQMRGRMEEQREALDKLKAINIKQDAEIMHLKDMCKEQPATTTALVGRNEEQFRKLLEKARDAFDRKPYAQANEHDVVGVPKLLLQLPHEITSLYEILDEYSARLQVTGTFASVEELTSAIDAAKEVNESRKELEELRRQVQELRLQGKQPGPETSSEVRQHDPMRPHRMQSTSLQYDSDQEVVTDPVTGQPIARTSGKKYLKSHTQGLERMCDRLVQFHHNIVDNIVGVGTSKLSKKHADVLLQSAKDGSSPLGGAELVDQVCEALEEYMQKYWTASGIKDMAESIRNVTEIEASKASARFNHLSQMKRLRDLMDSTGKKKAASGEYLPKWLSGLMERYEDQKRRWEEKKSRFIQERANSIIKCMSSVVHVVTLNIGINLTEKSRKDIINALQMSCVGRGNAFWPRQITTSTEREQPTQESTMKSSNSSNHALFVKSLPLHKALQDDGGVSHSSARHSWLELRSSRDVSLRARSPRGVKTSVSSGHRSRDISPRGIKTSAGHLQSDYHQAAGGSPHRPGRTVEGVVARAISPPNVSLAEKAEVEELKARAMMAPRNEARTITIFGQRGSNHTPSTTQKLQDNLDRTPSSPRLRQWSPTPSPTMRHHDDSSRHQMQVMSIEGQNRRNRPGSSGEWIAARLPAIPNKQGLQLMQSSLSFYEEVSQSMLPRPPNEFEYKDLRDSVATKQRLNPPDTPSTIIKINDKGTMTAR